MMLSDDNFKNDESWLAPRLMREPERHDGNETQTDEE